MRKAFCSSVRRPEDFKSNAQKAAFEGKWWAFYPLLAAIKILAKVSAPFSLDLFPGRHVVDKFPGCIVGDIQAEKAESKYVDCLLYTSDAADD